MADFDKDSILNMINGLISDTGKNENSSPQDTNSTPSNNFPLFENTDFADTAELMSRMTGVIDKLNKTKNNREFVLLSAVKPYMRSSRRGKIDACLRLLQVVNVVNEMKKES